MVGTIIDFFMTLERQAKCSLTGKPCRSKKDSVAKDQFPPELLRAIQGSGAINVLSS